MEDPTISAESPKPMSERPLKNKKGKVKKSVWVNLSHTHYPLVKRCVLEMGWKVTESNIKNLLFWCDAEGTSDIASHLERYQFYNHFPGMWAIAHKVELVKNFDKMSRLLPDLYNFHPKSFIIPNRLYELREFMSGIPKKSKRTFIVKPDMGAQGKGIILIQNADELDDYDDSAVCQQYVEPFLIDDLKFDLRIYVLVTSCNPLRIYTLNEGMSRFCTEPYKKPKSSNLKHCYSHLTNYSLNKNSSTYQSNGDNPSPDTGSKRSMSSVFKKLEEMGQDVEKLRKKIDDIIRLTLLAIQPHLQCLYHTTIAVNDGKSRCFEILGFDILIDSKCNPWLIEVNTMPSLSTGSQFDEVIKRNAVLGALKIIDLKPIYKKRCQNRLKEMALLKGPPLPICYFDPMHETELSKETEWRQIYPILDENDTETIEMCNKALEAASLGLYNDSAAARRRKELAQKMRENSKPTLRLLGQTEKEHRLVALPLTKNNDIRPRACRVSQSVRDTHSKGLISRESAPTTHASNSTATNILDNEIVAHKKVVSIVPRPTTAPGESNRYISSYLTVNTSHSQHSAVILDPLRYKEVNKQSDCKANLEQNIVRPKSTDQTPRTILNRLNSSKTTRSVILANEARISRMLASERREKTKDIIPFFMIYTELPQLRIDENEEKERLRFIKSQKSLTTNMGIIQKIKLMVKGVAERPKPFDFALLKANDVHTKYVSICQPSLKNI